MATTLASAPQISDLNAVVLVNIGVNDMSGDVVTQTQSSIESDLSTALDTIHTKWPRATVYVAYPWKVGNDNAANTYAGYIDNVLATRSWAPHGIDERITLKGSDNGSSETTDGVHYSTLGASLIATAWKNILGFFVFISLRRRRRMLRHIELRRAA